MNPEDTFDGGCAYRWTGTQWQRLPDDDLHMLIVEHTKKITRRADKQKAE
jgi:hypothetical protein